MDESNQKSPGVKQSLDELDAVKYATEYLGTFEEIKKFQAEEKAIRQMQKARSLGEGYGMRTMKFDEEMLRKFTGIMMEESNRPKVDKLKAKRKDLQNYLGKIDKCIEQAEKLQFKDGDVIYSRDHGPIIVSEIVVDIDEPAYQSDSFAKEPFKFYYKGYGKGGMVSVKAEDALPYNEATKLLYEKSKPK